MSSNPRVLPASFVRLHHGVLITEVKCGEGDLGIRIPPPARV